MRTACFDGANLPLGYPACEETGVFGTSAPWQALENGGCGYAREARRTICSIITDGGMPHRGNKYPQVSLEGVPMDVSSRNSPAPASCWSGLFCAAANVVDHAGGCDRRASRHADQARGG